MVIRFVDICEIVGQYFLNFLFIIFMLQDSWGHMYNVNTFTTITHTKYYLRQLF